MLDDSLVATTLDTALLGGADFAEVFVEPICHAEACRSALRSVASDQPGAVGKPGPEPPQPAQRLTARHPSGLGSNVCQLGQRPHVVVDGGHGQRPGLPEKGIHFPVLLLLPIIEWMIVTLGALNLQTKKQPRGRSRRQRRVFFVNLVDQVVDRAAARRSIS